MDGTMYKIVIEHNIQQCQMIWLACFRGTYSSRVFHLAICQRKGKTTGRMKIESRTKCLLMWRQITWNITDCSSLGGGRSGVSMVSKEGHMRS